MNARISLLPFETRPPCLPPREAPIEPKAARRLQAWVRAALTPATVLSLTIEEWVASDSRTVPHVVIITCLGSSLTHIFRIEKAAHKITEEDVRSACRASKQAAEIASRSPSAHARHLRSEQASPEPVVQTSRAD